MSTYNPYERRYGTQYEATKNMTTKEVAAHLRRVIKQAAKDGLLHGEYKYSVRLSRSTWSSCIDVYIIVPDAVIAERDAYEAQGGKPRYHHADRLWFDTPAQYATLSTLAETEAALNELRSSYNYDGSDSMTDYFDVRFYGSVTVVGETHWNKFYK